MMMVPCYNRGCGQNFDPENNNDDSCQHHPGLPYFHDVYKGWSCCNKKSVDFTEFLNIKGCTLSKHSNVKPEEPKKPQKDVEKDIEDKPKKLVREPIRTPMVRPAIDTPLTSIIATVASTLKDAVDQQLVKGCKKDEGEDSNELTVGTACKNHGCKYSYTDTSADAVECQYHSGVPIFHEGMKFWSCCQRKTTDFAVFMAQKGCTYGQHKWFNESNKNVVQCRYDWHQTATNVIVSIYAKLYDYRKSKIEVNPVRLHCHLIFPAQENATFNLDLELRGVINVEKTSAHMYGTKVEITMPKAEPGSWKALDFPNTTLPPPRKATDRVAKEQKTSNSDDDFNLDDIEMVRTGIRLAELSTKQENDLD